MRPCPSREPGGTLSATSACTGGAENLQETIGVSATAHCFELPGDRYATVIAVLTLIPVISGDHGAGATAPIGRLHRRCRNQSAARQRAQVPESARPLTRKEQCPDAHRLPRARRPGRGVEPYPSDADSILRLR